MKENMKRLRRPKPMYKEEFVVIGDGVMGSNLKHLVFDVDQELFNKYAKDGRLLLILNLEQVGRVRSNKQDIVELQHEDLNFLKKQKVEHDEIRKNHKLRRQTKMVFK